MKRLFVCVLSLFAVVAVAEAQSRLEHLTVKSEILGVEKSYSVYLPAGYDTSGERYPVLYLLHGAWGNHKSWNRDGGGEQPRITDEQIAAGNVVKMIVVMPDATGIGARRGSHKNHLKGPKKRTEEDDKRFAQSFEKLVLVVRTQEGD